MANSKSTPFSRSAISALAPNMLSGPEYSFISSLMHDSNVGLLVGGIATARRRQQSLAVEHGYSTAFIFYQAAPLQCSGGERDPDPAYAEHERQKFVGHIEGVGMGAILHHQKPTAKACVDGVEANTRGRRGELVHQDVQITKQRRLQRGTLF